MNIISGGEFDADVESYIAFLTGLLRSDVRMILKTGGELSSYGKLQQDKQAMRIFPPQ